MTDESYGSGDEIFLHKRRSKSKDAQTCRTDDIMNLVWFNRAQQIDGRAGQALPCKTGLQTGVLLLK